MGTRHVAASFGQVHQLPQILYTSETQRDADTVFSENPDSLFQSAFISDIEELQMLISNTPGPGQWISTMTNPTPGIDTVLAVGQVIDGDNREIIGENNSRLKMEFFDTDLSSFTRFSRILLDLNLAIIGRSDGDGAGNVTDTQFLQFSDAQILLEDTKNEQGIVYAADYSGNFTDRSLIDKAYADGLIHGNIYTEDGTITNTSRVFTGETDATLLFDFFDTDSSNYQQRGQFQIEPDFVRLGRLKGDGLGDEDGTQFLIFNTTEILLSDTLNSKGILYAADYSSSFTDRSLIDKAFVGPGSIYTASGTWVNQSRFVEGETNSILSFDFYDSDSSNFDFKSQFRLEPTSTIWLLGEGNGSGLLDSQKSIEFSSSAMTIVDGTSAKGLEYSGDYSGNFVDRSLVDKAFVLGQDFVNGPGAAVVDKRIVTWDGITGELIQDGSTITLDGGTFTSSGAMSLDAPTQWQAMTDGNMFLSHGDSETLMIRPNPFETPTPGTIARLRLGIVGTETFSVDAFTNTNITNMNSLGDFNISSGAGIVATHADGNGFAVLSDSDGSGRIRLGSGFPLVLVGNSGTSTIATFGSSNLSLTVAGIYNLTGATNLINTHGSTIGNEFRIKPTASNTQTRFCLGDDLSTTLLDITAIKTTGVVTMLADGEFFLDSTNGAINIEKALNLSRASSATDLNSDNEVILAVTDTTAPRNIVILTVDLVDNRVFWCQDESGNASALNPVTVAGESGTINGAASIPITVPYGGFWVRAFGGNLFAIG
jgi:hypothetical protein